MNTSVPGGPDPKENGTIFLGWLKKRGGLRGADNEKKNSVKGSRIYMSHAAAQKLAESLSKLLDMVHSDGEMETYSPVSDHTHSNSG